SVLPFVDAHHSGAGRASIYVPDADRLVESRGATLDSPPRVVHGHGSQLHPPAAVGCHAAYHPPAGTRLPHLVLGRGTRSAAVAGTLAGAVCAARLRHRGRHHPAEFAAHPGCSPLAERRWRNDVHRSIARYGQLSPTGLGERNLGAGGKPISRPRSEEHTSELQSRENLVCCLL